MSGRRLEIGPGAAPLGEGWETLDVTPAREPGQWQAVWGVSRLPFDDATFELIYASHVLEHVPWFRTHHALAEAHRILRPGGCLELWVPDFGYLVECYLAYQCGDDWRHQNPDGDPMRWLNGRLFAYGPPQANWHRAVFDRVGLTRQLLAAGFAAVTRLDSPRGYDHGRINLGVTAWKRSE